MSFAGIVRDLIAAVRGEGSTTYINLQQVQAAPDDGLVKIKLPVEMDSSSFEVPHFSEPVQVPLQVREKLPLSVLVATVQAANDLLQEHAPPPCWNVGCVCLCIGSLVVSGRGTEKALKEFADGPLAVDNEQEYRPRGMELVLVRRTVPTRNGKERMVLDWELHVAKSALE